MKNVRNSDDWDHALALLERLDEILQDWLEGPRSAELDLEDVRRIRLLQMKAKKLRDRTSAKIRAMKREPIPKKVRWIRRKPS